MWDAALLLSHGGFWAGASTALCNKMWDLLCVLCACGLEEEVSGWERSEVLSLGEMNAKLNFLKKLTKINELYVGWKCSWPPVLHGGTFPTSSLLFSLVA